MKNPRAMQICVRCTAVLSIAALAAGIIALSLGTEWWSVGAGLIACGAGGLLLSANVDRLVKQNHAGNAASIAMEVEKQTNMEKPSIGTNQSPPEIGEALTQELTPAEKGTSGGSLPSPLGNLV